MWRLMHFRQPSLTKNDNVEQRRHLLYFYKSYKDNNALMRKYYLKSAMLNVGQ